MFTSVKKEANIELKKMLLRQSSRPNPMSPKPSFSRAKASPLRGSGDCGDENCFPYSKEKR